MQNVKKVWALYKKTANKLMQKQKKTPSIIMLLDYSIVKCSQLGGAKSLRNANKIENAFFCSFSFFFCSIVNTINNLGIVLYYIYLPGTLLFNIKCNEHDLLPILCSFIIFFCT
jgi:hypothetical protein